MENEKCNKDCSNCDLSNKLLELINQAIEEKRPVFMIAEVNDERSTILLHGERKDLLTLLINAINNDERMEELFMDVMSFQTRKLLKQALGDDIIGEIKDKIQAHEMPKPKAEC